MSTTPEKADATELEEKFKEILRLNGITESVSEINIRDAGLKGEGFASLTQVVTVKFENPQVPPLNLFVKSPTPSASHIELLDEMKAFEKEATFLFSYVNAAKEMCKRKGREGFIDFYPKCYSGDEKMIVLENLVLDKGYKTVSLDVRQNLEEAKASIVTLAKHFAIGHVMIQECGGAKEFFKIFPNLDYEAYDKPVFAAMQEPAFDNSINPCVKILKTSGVQGADVAAAKLTSFLGKGWGIVLDALKVKDKDSLLGLAHGDYWNNNMMFLRDKETNKILHHVAIDFQITRYSSPGVDLGFYLFASVQPKVRQNHLRELLELYRSTFNSVTEDFGHPANLKFENVFLDFRRTLGFGFWMGFTVAVGPVMSLFKETDLSQVDPIRWYEVLSGLVDKWIDKNPDKTVEVAKELIGLMKEYEELSIHD